MLKLLAKVQLAYPKLVFTAGEQFHWSPKTQEVFYNPALSSAEASWSLLHEVGHALLSHTTYETDLELIAMEAAAWQKAQELAGEYQITIDEEHIQDCLDTYRDWLHQRSACPDCDNRSLQQDSRHYRCFNCGQTWSVSSSRFCRPYRLTKQTKTPPPKPKTTFA